MAEINQWVYGNWVGPGSRFRAGACVIGAQDLNNGKYKITVRYKVQVDPGENGFGSTIAYASWMSGSFTMGGTGANFDVPSTVVDKTYEQLYGSTLSLKFEAYYNLTNGQYKSSSTLTYNVPNPSYTITYDANGEGVSSLPASHTKAYNEDIYISSITPKREGYYFSGWNTSSNGGGASYSFGEKYTINASLTLYAQWEEITYQIMYFANGGYNCPVAQTKSYFSDLTLSTIIPIRPGHQFLGWSSISDLNHNKVTYNPGDIYSINASENLYALWEAQNIAYYKVGAKYVLCNTYGKVGGKWEPRLMYIKVNDKYVRTTYGNYDNTDVVFQSFDRVEPSGVIEVLVGTSQEDFRKLIEVYGLYSDGSIRLINDYTFEKYEVIEGQESVVLIRYGGNKIRRITVIGVTALQIIELTAEYTGGNLNEGYLISKQLLSSSIIVTAKYSNNDIKQIEDYTLIPLNGDRIVVGVNRIDIVVPNTDATCYIEIIGYQYSASIIGMTATPSETEVLVGKKVDNLSVSIKLSKNDGSFIIVQTRPGAPKPYTLFSDQGDTIVEGRNIIHVNYEYEGVLYETFFEIFGITGTSEEPEEPVFEYISSVQYSSNTVPVGITEDELREIITVYGMYSDGIAKEITDYVFLNSTIIEGENEIIIQYQDDTDSIIIYGEPEEDLGIELSATYIGDKLTEGTPITKEVLQEQLIVTITYPNQDPKEITNYDVTSDYEKIIVGNNTIKITDLDTGLYDYVYITGSEDDITGLSVEVLQTELTPGLTMDEVKDYIRVYVHYVDTDPALVPPNAYTLTNDTGDTIVEGNNHILVQRIINHRTYETSFDIFGVVEIPEEPGTNVVFEYISSVEYDKSVPVGITESELRKKLKVYGAYSDGSTKIITDYIFLNSTINEGKNTIIIQYQNYTYELILYGEPKEVEPPSIIDLTVTMSQTEFTEGTTLNEVAESIVEVRVNYSDGSSVPLVGDPLPYTLWSKAGDVIVVGENTIEVCYVENDWSYYGTIVVYGIPVVFERFESIEYDKLVPVQTTESELREMITVYGKYSDGNIKEITDYTFLDYELIEGQSTRITIEYQGKTDYFTVTVTSGLKSIVVTEYTGGNKLVGTRISELTGVNVDAIYLNGDRDSVTSGFTLSSESGTTAFIQKGENTILVTYKDKTTTFTVTGYSLDSISAEYTGTEPSVPIGTSLSDIQYTVIASYSDGHTEDVTEKATVSGNISIIGDNEISVSYKEGSSTRKTTFIVIGFMNDVESDIQFGEVQQLEVASWLGTGASGKQQQVIYSNSIEVIDEQVVLSNEYTITFVDYINNSNNNYDSLLGKYIRLQGNVYYIAENSQYSHYSQGTGYKTIRIVYTSAQLVTVV